MRLDPMVDVSDNLPAFLGATEGYCGDDVGERILALAFGDQLDEAEYRGVTVCDAYELRNALDRFLGTRR